MALKKSELYSSLWRSCDELRGGMDASQYKDYVLVLLFIKYVSDKYASQPYAPITIPEGASFKDLVALKGKSDIGDQINKKIIAPLQSANRLSDMPDFNDPGKLGSGKDMVDRLTNLIAIFENRALDFSKNRADGDDILGDAYEYLMRHFATESGKSKGQFYTPAEVSRTIAQIIAIRDAATNASTTVYDPTCGSGSLLLKVADEAGTPVTLYGQEKDAATSGLARMNMILHNNPTAVIEQGNTLASPRFTEGDTLKTFDYVVANPPFSDKAWSNGLDPSNDHYDRFKSFGTPPAKQGDFAYLLHIVRSLRSTGKGACILPHGVLFRGNAELEIRRALVRRGYVKGIVGLPPNLFYGTGIPACIVVLDKEHAHARKGIFMVDASAGYIKDGPKNRLRAQDIHRIVDVFTRQLDVPRFSRMVGFDEIEKNEFNLNLPRYIDSQLPEDAQDIAGHLQGGIPATDVDALARYWDVCPGLRQTLFQPRRPGYLDLAVEKAAIRSTIFEHPEFVAFAATMNAHFAAWRHKSAATLHALAAGCHPKAIIAALADDLLAHYRGNRLVDAYDVYQRLMDYWVETMQDDCYLIAADGWKAETYRVVETDKKGKERDKGWTCDLVPRPLVVARYDAREQAAVDCLAADLESATAAIAELEEEHGGEGGFFAELDAVNKASVAARLRERRSFFARGDDDSTAEAAALAAWLELDEQRATLKRHLRDADADLDAKALARYPKLTVDEIKALVVDDKWLDTLDAAIHGEQDRVSHQLTQRVTELAERYETPLPQLVTRVAELQSKVTHHLEAMGFPWNLEQGAMQDLLTGKRRLPGFSGRWSRVRLGNICQISIGRTPPRLNSEYWGRGYTWLTIADLKSKVVRESKEEITALAAATMQVVPKGSLLMSFKLSLGRLCFAGSDLYTNEAICSFSQLKANADYLYYALGRTNFSLYGKQAVKGYTLNSESLNEVEVWLPPEDEQSAIAAVLSDMDAELDALEAKLAKTRQLKQGMMQELLTAKSRSA